MTTEEVREILRMAQHPISLEKPIGEEEDSELGDFVEDDQAESPFDSASLTLRRSDIENALSSLPGARAAGDRASLRARRLPAVHARGGRQGVRRHARADPPDREQHAEEARVPARGAGAPRLRLDVDGQPSVRCRRHEQPAVRALEAAVALGPPSIRSRAERLLAVRAHDVDGVVLEAPRPRQARLPPRRQLSAIDSIVHLVARPVARAGVDLRDRVDDVHARR